MEIHPLLPDLFFRQMEEGDLDGVHRSIDLAGSLGDGWRHLMRGVRRFAGFAELRAQDPPAAVVVDAVQDLIPTIEDGDPSPLIEALARYLMGRPRSAPPSDCFEEPGGEPSPDIVPISTLQDALAEGDLGATCLVAGRLVRVIRTREYFFEILLELTAADRSDGGNLLVQSNATVKSLHELDWEAGRGLTYRLLEAASAAPILSLPGGYADLPPLPCRAALLATLELPEPEAAWLYISHAFQADRYAQLRRKGVRAGLRGWLAERLFGADPDLMDLLEQQAEPRIPADPGDSPQPLPPGEGESIAADFVRGTPELSQEMARRIQLASDADPLYGWLSLGAAVWLRQGIPGPIIAVNAARWGSHLLGPTQRGLLTARLVERSRAWERPVF